MTHTSIYVEKINDREHGARILAAGKRFTV